MKGGSLMQLLVGSPLEFHPTLLGALAGSPTPPLLELPRPASPQLGPGGGMRLEGTARSGVSLEPLPNLVRGAVLPMTAEWVTSGKWKPAGWGLE